MASQLPKNGSLFQALLLRYIVGSMTRGFEASEFVASRLRYFVIHGFDVLGFVASYFKWFVSSGFVASVDRRLDDSLLCSFRVCCFEASRLHGFAASRLRCFLAQMVCCFEALLFGYFTSTKARCFVASKFVASRLLYITASMLNASLLSGSNGSLLQALWLGYLEASLLHGFAASGFVAS